MGHPFWRWLLLACALSGAVPLWLTDHLPFTDLPQHAAAIASLRHWWDPVFRVQEHFTLALSQTQYLLYYLLGALLAFPFGTAERANLVLLSLIAIGFPYSLRSLLRALEFDERLSLFASTLFWSQALLIGFFNYVAAMPMMLYGLALAVRLARAPSRKLQIQLGLLSLAIFYMHLSAFLFFAPAAGLALLILPEGPTRESLPAALGAQMSDVAKRTFEFIRAALPRFYWTLPSIAGTLLFVLKSPVVHPSNVGWQQPMKVEFDEIDKALRNLPDALLDIWHGPQDEWCLLALLAALALLAWPRADDSEAPQLSRRRSLVAAWLAFAATLYFAFPVSIGWLWQLNERYALVFALLVPLLLRPARGLRGAVPLVLVALTALFAGNNALTQFRVFEKEVGAFDRVLDHTEPGKHLISMIFEQNSKTAKFSAFLHFGSYYRARKGGVASFSFAELPQSPLRYIPGMGPPTKAAGWEWHPTDFNNAREGAYYDYWLVHGMVDPLTRLQLAGGPQWHLTVREGGWALYEKVP